MEIFRIYGFFWINNPIILFCCIRLILKYIYISITNLPTTSAIAADTFNNLVSKDIFSQVALHTIVSLTVIWIVLKGIKDGIEKINHFNAFTCHYYFIWIICLRINT